MLMLAVWDGHGGKECAEFCAENVALHLTKNLEAEVREKELSSFGEGIDLEAVVRRLLVGLNVSFERHWKASGDGTAKTPGTTATVALLRDGLELVVGHVGDSRCVLCRGSTARRLTRDHCPSDDDERARIEKAGGFVVADNVGRHMVNGRLAMSRSIGDLDLKPFGVTAEPEVTRTVIKHSKDRFLLLASDGISFVMTDQVRTLLFYIRLCS
jgi:protein phosphatase 1K